MILATFPWSFETTDTSVYFLNDNGRIGKTQEITTWPLKFVIDHQIFRSGDLWVTAIKKATLVADMCPHEPKIK